MATVRGGVFESVLPIAKGQTQVRVASFKLDVTPVSNAEFAVFLAKKTEWRRDRIGKLFADGSYLAHWRSATDPGEAIAHRPATQVSWYAAREFCKARQARLPTWYEWEFAAAASATATDARQDPPWRRQILEWYSRPGSELPDVGKSPPNIYGIRDLHGVVWEWIEDFNGMLVSADSREQGDPDVTRFCGSGALSMEQKDQYAILMRVAMLSSLHANYTTTTMGFRCAANVDGPAK
jgi:formylglycine-generating enzyme required for sulfatase activity